MAEDSLKRRKILIVDDEERMIRFIRLNLEHDGFVVAEAFNGKQALQRLRDSTPDLILLDVMMPDLDGFEVLEMIREISSVPVIMLTAKGEEDDRVHGLEKGADDYITKPFSPRELILRIKNSLKRRAPEETKSERIKVGGLVIDIPRHEITFQDQALDLTATEFKLMTVLAQRKGRVQSREQLLKDVWGYDNMIDTRTVDTHMRRLRDKLGGAAEYLDTVRGVGYRSLDV